MTKLSVVAPAFNEEDGIVFFLEELRFLLDSLNITYEVVIVNDGSSDETLSKVLNISWPMLQVVDLVSNSGHMAALEAGLSVSQGDLIITLDSDQQHPIDFIPRMIEIQSHTNCDVVVGVRLRGNEDSLLKRTASRYFYKALGKISTVKIEQNAADFRLMTRYALDTLLSSPEKNKIFRFLVSDFGFKIESFEFKAKERKYDSSKYNFANLLELAGQSVIGFSTKPLTIIFLTGIVFMFFGIFYAIFLVTYYLLGHSVPGWTSMMLFLTIFSAFQFLAIGIIGRYLIEVLRQLRQRPSYLIRNIHKG